MALKRLPYTLSTCDVNSYSCWKTWIRVQELFNSGLATYLVRIQLRSSSVIVARRHAKRCHQNQITKYVISTNECMFTYYKQIERVHIYSSTSLKDPFHANATNYIIFFHSHKSNAPSIKKVQHKYLKLFNHLINHRWHQVSTWRDHRRLAISKTWMYASAPVIISNFNSFNNCHAHAALVVWSYTCEMTSLMPLLD